MDKISEPRNTNLATRKTMRGGGGGRNASMSLYYVTGYTIWKSVLKNNTFLMNY
jgi:hypothetical protein